MSGKRFIQPRSVARPVGQFTTAVVSPPGSFVFVSGLTSRDENGEVFGVGDIRAQTRQVCEKLRDTLREAGADLSDVVSVLVHVRDMNDFEAIHEVRREFFPVDPPASTMVEISRMVDERSLIEITATAIIPQ